MSYRYRRGEVYSVRLDPTEGHRAGRDANFPCLIVSHDRMNDLPSELCIVMPITSQVALPVSRCASTSHRQRAE